MIQSGHKSITVSFSSGFRSVDLLLLFSRYSRMALFIHSCFSEEDSLRVDRYSCFPILVLDLAELDELE